MINDKETGLLVEPRSVDSLTGALQYLLDNPAAARSMGEKAAELAWREYTWEKNVDRLLKLFDEVAYGKK